MIAPGCFTSGWIRDHAEELRARDMKTLEKCMLALELVARLRQAGLEFIFKGGTSLALLFDPPRRLSIDVDILCLEPIGKLREALDQATFGRMPFVRWEHQEHRDREAPPTRHFRALYGSAFGEDPSQAIQVDVILAESPYAKVDLRPVGPAFLEIEERVEVMVPSASSLLGDKIAAFAPATIGYPYQPIVAATGEPGEQRPIKVVKHLFDIAALTGLAANLDETIRTYGKIHAEQVHYRGLACSTARTLDDTQDAAFWVSRVDMKPREDNEKTEFFRKGIRALDSHLFSETFQRAESRLAAGRAALAAELIRARRADFNLPAFLNAGPDLQSLGPASLDAPWQNLNRLKQTDPSAFACWFAAQEIRCGADSPTGPIPAKTSHA